VNIYIKYRIFSTNYNDCIQKSYNTIKHFAIEKSSQKSVYYIVVSYKHIGIVLAHIFISDKN